MFIDGKKGYFSESGKFDKELARQEDIDFAIRMGFKGGHFIGIKEKVLKQYSTPSIKKHPKVEFNSSLKIIEKNSAYLKKKKIHDYIKNWTKLRYFHFFEKIY